MLQQEQVTLPPEQGFQLVEHRGQCAGVAEVGVSGLEPVEARRERVLIGGGPACGGGALPVVERKIELQPVGRDDGKAREQVRRGGLVAQQLREAQALGEMRLAIADRHAEGHRHVPAELPQGQHFQRRSPTARAAAAPSEKSASAAGNAAAAFMRPAADDPGAGTDLGMRQPVPQPPAPA